MGSRQGDAGKINRSIHFRPGSMLRSQSNLYRIPPVAGLVLRRDSRCGCVTAFRSTRECAVSACSCKGLPAERPLPSHSLTESPNHVNYKFRLDSFMAGDTSGRRAAWPKPYAPRKCPFVFPVSRNLSRHFVQLFHNNFRLVVRPERPGDIHVATGLVSFVAGRSVSFSAVTSGTNG